MRAPKRRLMSICALCLAMVFGAPIAAAQATFQFDLPEQPLADALRAIARQTGANILFESSSVKEIRVPALRAQLTTDEAIQRLLAGTKLEIQKTTPDAIIVQPESAAKSIGPISTGARGVESTVASVRLAQNSVSTGAQTEKPDQESSAAARKDDLATKRTELGEVVVTGTHIRGTAPVGANVITIDREELDRSGFATVDDVFRVLPQNFGGGPGEDLAKPAAAGAEAGTNTSRGTSINLRGLSSAATLVLIDGRRLAPGGQQGAFTDVSSLPLSAVERIEVLPDGASALYGADAVGGVINIIMRRNYTGAESRARIATVTEGSRNEYQLGQTFGTSWASGNGLLALEYQSQDMLLAKDRRHRGFSDLQPLGGDNFDRPNGNPGTIVIFDPVLGERTWAIPAGQDGSSLDPGDLVEGTVNLHNRHEGADYLPETSRWSVFGTGRQRVGERIELFADVLLSNRETDSLTGALPITLPVPSTNAFYVNPTGGTDTILVHYSLLDDIGPPNILDEVDTLNVAAGSVFGMAGGWQLTGYLGYAREDANRYASGDQIDFVALSAALADSDPNTAFNPFGDGSFTNPATLATIIAPSAFATDSDLLVVNVKADGALMTMPGGSLRLAVGGDYREQSFASFNSVVPGPAASPFERAVRAAYAELFVPIVGNDNARPGLNRLEFSLAARYEDYDDFGDTINPKFGLTWAPVGAWALRGTWGTSFRAPNLADLDEGPTQNGTVIFPLTDPESPTGFSDVLLWFGKNRDLQEETATNWTLGVEITPPSLSAFRLGLTYFDIEYEDRIESLPGIETLADPRFFSFIIRNPTAEQLDRACSNSFFFGDFSGVNGPCNRMNTVLVDNRVQNTAIFRTSGFDLLGAYRIESSAGAFDLGLNATYLRDFSRAISSTSPLEDQLNQRNQPVDLKLRGSVAFSRGSLGATAFVNYVDSYEDTVSVPQRKIDSWTTIDLQLAYTSDASNGSLMSGTTVSLTATNLFDADAPFVNDSSGIGYDPDNATVLGRLVSLSIRKSW